MRNNDLDARNTFATVRPNFRYNQYGAALGGPVNLPKVYHGRDKTFFFANWEQYKYDTATSTITSTPPPHSGWGTLPQLFTNQQLI